MPVLLFFSFFLTYCLVVVFLYLIWVSFPVLLRSLEAHKDREPGFWHLSTFQMFPHLWFHTGAWECLDRGSSPQQVKFNPWGSLFSYYYDTTNCLFDECLPEVCRFMNKVPDSKYTSLVSYMVSATATHICH